MDTYLGINDSDSSIDADEERSTEVTYVEESSSPCSEDFDTDLEDIVGDDKTKRTKTRENVDIGHHSYKEACAILGNPAIRKVKQQLKESEICLRHVGLNTNDVIALTYALLHNSRVESLDLTDNGLEEEALLHVVEVLRHNISISSLNLSENRVSIRCITSLTSVVEETTWLSHLNLSGTSLGDDGARHLATGIRGNVSIVWLNISHNEIGEMGAKHISKALTINDTLQVLDLSWNHIRMIGAVIICKGLQSNSSISNLNLSWNGFGFEGSLGLEDVLKQNMALKVLDVSNNRINWEAVVHIARGLKINNVLQIFKIGSNPISMEGCKKILEAVDNDESNLTHISFEDIPITTKIVNMADDIACRRRPFTIIHGGVTDSHFLIGIKRVKREDPFSLLIRYISMMGIRIMDLFRVFDCDNNANVTKANFIRGLQKIGAPLSVQDMRRVARRLDRRGDGSISYSILANGVRNHLRDERKEDLRLELIEKQKREKRKSILKAGTNQMRPIQFSEISLFSTVAGKNFSRLLSSSSSMSSRNGSIAGRDSLFLPPVPEPTKNNCPRAMSLSYPMLSEQPMTLKHAASLPL